MKYYVILTGGKNNAGDFLIINRAKELLKRLRPDREVINLNAWQPLTDENIEVINKSEILLLTGGPALREHMYPVIYNLCEDLKKIKVPIATFGIGWKSKGGSWEDIYHYPFSNDTLALLDRIESSGYKSSVRDYHSLYVLKNRGYNNFLMTGCPALYTTTDKINFNVKNPKVVYFSIGVGHKESKNMEVSCKRIISRLAEKYHDIEFKVIFHHSISNDFLKTPDAKPRLFKSNLNIVSWLEKSKIAYEDISGSSELLINAYNKCDLHIGYRVHAHIFMSSVNKPSILISEDGRGKALSAVISGIIFDGFGVLKTSKVSKLLSKLKIGGDRYIVDKNLENLILDALDYEAKNNSPRLKMVQNHIKSNYEIMKSFVHQLP